ncbi:uncharacterized protein TEOVI_000661800 [Trypanosoma equiperdum]|uniref:Uncharacterized protein n=2 Tax=Trypanozoon TaxID=39700 RepID=Q381Q1_TRYB2|nr:hypothetical protein, conserved [Trypanosoma brucei brucei TREU927]EAN80480.1 hypothetical protein, conserved [Trypanosoma brucei brucei TREU927]SCU65804.1 hypothetical protein, conserved [Trypanosoma equiperdum]
MPRDPFNVAFYDSSDDEQNSHIARVEPVMEDSQTTIPLQPSFGDQAGSPSQLRRLFDTAGSYIMSALIGRRDLGSSEPFNVAQVPHDSTSNDEQWDDRAVHDPFGPARPPLLCNDNSLCSSDDVGVDLREVILQYRRTPNDSYMGIIQASLHAENFRINGDILQAAVGDRHLTKTLLKSGRVDVNDVGVQQIIQEEIDSLMVGDENFGGRINPGNIDYLKVLCNAPSATFTKEQALSCRYAGLEFVKMLYDNPHLLRNLPPPNWLLGFFLHICFVLDMALTWVGLIAVFLHLACVGWVIYHWRVVGHIECSSWTIVCYVVGYVVSIVAVMTSEEGRIRDYEDRVWDYPDNTTKVVPCVPVFEVWLVYVTLRYELLKNKAKYFVIRYDLYNGLTNVLLLHTCLFSIPQLLLQYYLAAFYAYGDSFIGHTILAITNYTSYGVSTYLFLRNAICNFSCNRFGFAVVATKQVSLRPRSVTNRILIATTSCYLECCLFAVLLTFPVIGQCHTETVVFVSTASFATVVGFVLLVVVLVFDAHRVIWAACWPAAAVQVVFTIVYIYSGKLMDDPLGCSFFSLTSSSVPILTYVTFGFLCLSILAGIGVFIYDKVTGGREVMWDSYYFWSMRR